MSYTTDAKDAYNDILEDGALMIVKRVTIIEDPITGDTVEGIESQRLPCVVFADKNVMSKDVMSNGVVAGSLTAQNSRNVLAAAYGALFTPRNGDKFFYAEEWWTIIGCSPLNPDGNQAIIFKFGIQK